MQMYVHCTLRSAQLYIQCGCILHDVHNYSKYILNTFTHRPYNLKQTTSAEADQDHELEIIIE